MKHLLIALLVGCVVGSCSKELKYKIQSASTTIHYNETLQLKMNQGANSDYVWKSSNAFVGSVDTNGVFTANHIGKTTVTAEREGALVASLNLDVQPLENFFEEPYALLGVTQQLIKSKEKRVLAKEDSHTLKYLDSSPVLKDTISYAFNAGLSLRGILIYFNNTPANAAKVNTFYAERYRRAQAYDTWIHYVDRNKKYSVIVTNDPVLGLLVTYDYYSE